MQSLSWQKPRQQPLNGNSRGKRFCSTQAAG